VADIVTALKQIGQLVEIDRQRPEHSLFGVINRHIERLRTRLRDRRPVHHRFPARGRRITARLDDTELAAIELAAGRAGLTPTGYVGALAELMAARTQLRRFGTNVNQAVAALHATGEAPEWLAQAVGVTARAMRRVDAAAEALMRRRA